MAIYFVDYENVGSTGIEGIDTLSADNTVHIFYSVKADTMKMDQVIQLMRVAANVEFHDVTMRGQKNALDFQLIAMLYFTKRDEDTCYIISKDQGYDAAIIFGRKIGAEQVYRRVSINSENIGENKAQQANRRTGKRGDNARTAGQQEQPVLLAERAQGVTTLPYQREYIRPPRRDGRKAPEQTRREEVKTAEPVRKEEVKAAEPAKQEEVKAAEPAAKEEAKAAEPAAKEEAKVAEPAKQDEVKAAEPAKQEEVKAAEPAEAEEDLGFLKAAAQWDIFQSSIGGFFDYDIPAEYADGEDDDLTAEELVKKEPEAAEQKEEPAKKEKNSRQRSRQSRRRSQRQKAENAQNAQQTEEVQEVQAAAEPEKAEETKPETATVLPAEEAKAEEPKAEKPQKAASRKKKEKKPAEETAKKTEKTKKAEKEAPAAKDYKEIEERVAEVMTGAGFSLDPEDNALIAKALVSSSTKNQFYQFFRKTKGEAAGREFYLKIRGQYESLKVLREA